MKRFFLPVLMFLFLVMTACGVNSATKATNASQTQSAAPVIPTAFNTPGPAEGQIVARINEVLHASEDGLAATVDATYLVDRVVFGQDNKGMKMFVQARCQCALNGTCCNLEHTFVVVANAMKANVSYIIGWIPPGVIELQIVCLDHQSTLGTVTVPWLDMQNYMLGITNGYQLGGVIKKVATKK